MTRQGISAREPPRSEPGKNIAVCLDGTGNEYGQHKTNVVHLFEAIVRDSRQIAFYDPGVGTFSSLGMPALTRFGVLLGKAFGVGLRQNLAEAYAFLMENYEPGDRVFLFGFSRGAFAARALAGMLRKCGLLDPGSQNLIPYAFKIYNQHGNGKVALQFKEGYSRECPPHLVGVWDTVGSLGWFLGKKFFDTRLNHEVAHGYHAVAIDEKRRKFPVSLWDEGARAEHQVIEQVWFAGCHSDVGGWHAERELSDITLEWMLAKAQAAGLRLLREEDRPLDLHPYPRGQMHESRTGLWRLWRPSPRHIPEGAKIHRSVFERPAYNPSLPVDFEIAEWCRPQELPDSDSPNLELFRDLVEIGATVIEYDPEGVWQEVRKVMGREWQEARLDGGTDRVPFLEAMPRRAIRQLVRHGLVFSVPAGAEITRKGSGGREMFVILDGELEATDAGRTLSRMGRGQLFGEIAFFHPSHRRMATVRATRDSLVLVLRRRWVEELIHGDPELATQLLRELGGIMAEHLSGPGGSHKPALSPGRS